MPWRDVKPMDEKILFIADHLREACSFAQLCERYGISRKTGYKWVERYQAEGIEGLEERSRRPHIAAGEIPYAIRKAVIELRRHGREPLGPKKIQALLGQRFPDQPIPSKTSIYNVLKREGMLEPKRRRRHVQPLPSSGDRNSSQRIVERRLQGAIQVEQRPLVLSPDRHGSRQPLPVGMPRSGGPPPRGNQGCI